MPGGKCHFNVRWLTKNEYSSWLREVNSNPHVGYCSLCKKEIDLKVMGESALMSHAKWKKHKQLVTASKPTVPISSFVAKTSGSAHVLQHSTSKAVSPSGSSFFTKTDVLKSEIIWTLNVVNSHLSYRSCEGSTQLFQMMFPDSNIAKGHLDIISLKLGTKTP